MLTEDDFITIKNAANLKVIKIYKNNGDFKSSEYQITTKRTGKSDIFSFTAFSLFLCTTLKVETEKGRENAESFIETAYEKNKVVVDKIESISINKKTADLFKNFLWHINRRGEITYFIKNPTAAQEYRNVADLINGSKVCYDEAGENSLFDMMQKKYEVLFNENSLFGHKKDVPGAEKPNTIMPMSQYFETILRQYWQDDKRFQLKETPKVIGNDLDQKCLKFIDVYNFKEGDCETWLKWETCIPKQYRFIWRAFIRSIFISKNEGRQLMWLFDPKGFTGKSTVQKVLQDYMTTDFCVSCPTTTKSAFSGSKFYGKRLFIIDDCKDPTLIRHQLYHSILSGGAVDIEFKNENSFSANVHCKGLVSSNIHPEFDITALHETSRIIVLPLHFPDNLHEFVEVDENNEPKYDPNGNVKPLGTTAEEFSDKLYNELEAYIKLCERAYNRLCPNDSDIKLCDELIDEMSGLCVTPDIVRWEDFVAHNFALSKEEHVEKITVCQLFKECRIGNGNYDYSNFIKWLGSAYGVKGIRTKLKDGSRPNVYLGMRLLTHVERKAIEIEEAKNPAARKLVVINDVTPKKEED